MKILNLVAALLRCSVSVIRRAAQDSHDHMKGMEMPAKSGERRRPRLRSSPLKEPA